MKPTVVWTHPVLDVLIARTECPACYHERNVTCVASGYADWVNGTVIQKAMPTLTTSEREALISGICDTCWDNLYSED